MYTHSNSKFLINKTFWRSTQNNNIYNQPLTWCNLNITIFSGNFIIISTLYAWINEFQITIFFVEYSFMKHSYITIYSSRPLHHLQTPNIITSIHIIYVYFSHKFCKILFYFRISILNEFCFIYVIFNTSFQMSFPYKILRLLFWCQMSKI